MSIKIKKGGVEMLNLNSGFVMSFNYERMLMKTELPYANQVYLYDMITTIKTYTLTADLNPETTGYATLLEVKTKLDALFPNSSAEFEIVDSEGIWNISKCAIETGGGSETPDKPNSLNGVSFKIIEYTTGFSAV